MSDLREQAKRELAEAREGYDNVVAERDALREELERLRAECRYEVEPGHFIRCPENHGSNGSLYDENTRLREALEIIAANEYGPDGDGPNFVTVARTALQALDSLGADS